MIAKKKTAKKKVTRGRPAKRRVVKGVAKKKVVKKKVAKKKKSTHKPSVSRLHSSQCKICNHPDLKDIEAAYMAGGSSRVVASMFKGLTFKNVIAHVNYLGLNRQRKYNSLNRIESMLDSYDSAVKAPLSEQGAVALIKLRAQIEGELIEKREETLDVKARIKIVADKRLINLAKRLGIPADELPVLNQGEEDEAT